MLVLADAEQSVSFTSDGRRMSGYRGRFLVTDTLILRSIESGDWKDAGRPGSGPIFNCLITALSAHSPSIEYLIGMSSGELMKKIKKTKKKLHYEQKTDLLNRKKNLFF